MQDASRDIANQPTTVYSVVPPLSFQTYMQQYRLLWSEVASVAAVPGIVVWSMEHGLAVSARHAEMVRSAVEKMTGVPFPGSIRIIGDKKG